VTSLKNRVSENTFMFLGEQGQEEQADIPYTKSKEGKEGGKEKKRTPRSQKKEGRNNPQVGFGP